MATPAQPQQTLAQMWAAPSDVSATSSSSPRQPLADVKPATKSIPAAATTSKKGKKVQEKEVFDPEGPIYDDCNDIRRKIRAYLSEGNKVTHLIRDLEVNSNSYGRFMKLSGPAGGCENGTFTSAYYFFEKKRIEEGKPKSAKRKRAETEQPHGLNLDYRPRWVFVGK